MLPTAWFCLVKFGDAKFTLPRSIKRPPTRTQLGPVQELFWRSAIGAMGMYVRSTLKLVAESPGTVASAAKPAAVGLAIPPGAAALPCCSLSYEKKKNSLSLPLQNIRSVPVKFGIETGPPTLKPPRK